MLCAMWAISRIMILGLPLLRFRPIFHIVFQTTLLFKNAPRIPSFPALTEPRDPGFLFLLYLSVNYAA